MPVRSGPKAASLSPNHVATGAKPPAAEELPPRFPIPAQCLGSGLGSKIGDKGDHAPQIAVGKRLGRHLGSLDSVLHHPEHVVIVGNMGELPSSQVRPAESPAAFHAVATGAVVAKEAFPNQNGVRVPLVGILLPLLGIRQDRARGGRGQDSSKDKERQPSRENSHTHLTRLENGLGPTVSTDFRVRLPGSQKTAGASMADVSLAPWGGKLIQTAWHCFPPCGRRSSRRPWGRRQDRGRPFHRTGLKQDRSPTSC